jgi:hypothetical protein
VKDQSEICDQPRFGVDKRFGSLLPENVEKFLVDVNDENCRSLCMSKDGLFVSNECRALVSILKTFVVVAEAQAKESNSSSNGRNETATRSKEDKEADGTVSAKETTSNSSEAGGATQLQKPKDQEAIDEQSKGDQVVAGGASADRAKEITLPQVQPGAGKAVTTASLNVSVVMEEVFQNETMDTSQNGSVKQTKDSGMANKTLASEKQKSSNESTLSKETTSNLSSTTVKVGLTENSSFVVD